MHTNSELQSECTCVRSKHAFLPVVKAQNTRRFFKSNLRAQFKQRSLNPFELNKIT